MRFYSFVLKNVFRRRARSALTMTGMAVAVGAVVAFWGLADGFKKSFLELYQNRGVDLIVCRSGLRDMLGGTMPEGIYRDVKALDGVAAVAPGLLEIISFKNAGLYNITLQGWPLESFMFQEYAPVEGRRLLEKDRGKRSIMVGKNLAEELKKKVGDKITLFDTEEFHIVGIYETFSQLENGGLIILLEDMQELEHKKGLISGCTIKLKVGPNITEVRDEVREKIENEIAAKYHMRGKIKAMPAQDIAKSAVQLKAVNGMALVTSVIALIIGTVFVLNTMVMSVFERTREIGILRAIGWRPWRVIRMILLESVLLCLSGGILGTGIAVALIWGVSKLPAVNGAVRGDISPIVILYGFVIALAVGLVGAAYPAYRGARLLPTEAIRHE